MEAREKLIKLRESMDMDPEQFAECLGVPHRLVRDWERGECDVPDYLPRIMAYKIGIDEQRKKREIHDEKK